MLPADEIALLRILDANANRAHEGLRVVEDFARFAWNNGFLAAQCKQLRHDLAALLSQIPASSRLAARETLADVGAAITTPTEHVRPSTEAVVAASWQRIEQALRVLEEYGKRLAGNLGPPFESLRYRAYTLEKAFDISLASRQRLLHARLYVLTSGANSPADFADRVQALLDAGVQLIQLRDKSLPDRTLLDRARQLVELTSGTNTLAIVNDRPDIAALARAHGVHLGQEELTVQNARSIVGPHALIGLSTHTLAQARAAVLEGANYIGVGPTFPSSTKTFSLFPGLELLTQVAAEISLPAFAIGGITRENLPQVLATGIGRVAVSSAICQAENPAAAVREMLNLL